MELELKPRKQPRQKRSQAVVDAIIEAATRILATEGFAKLTTNNVAELAGVSVGSLYQYFPNKEAICYAVSDRLFEEFTQSYMEALQEVADAPLRQKIIVLIDVGVKLARNFHVVTPSTYNDFNHFGGFDPMKKSRNLLVPALTEMLKNEPKEFRPKDPEYAAYISLTAVSEIIADASFNYPERLNDAVFVEHLYALVIGYCGTLIESDEFAKA